MGKHVSSIIEPKVMTKVQETEPSKKVGILGGTFNPPHIGHLVMAEQVKDQLGLETILFLPSEVPPHKIKKTTISSNHRLKMLELSIKDNAAFDILEVEINRGGKNYTYDTMSYLNECYPDTEFYFIIGADMVEDLPNWYKIEELVQIVQFVAVKRPSYQVETDYPVIIVDTPTLDISSSMIRQKVEDNCSIKYLVAPDTEMYIKKEGLYRNEGK